MLNGQPQLGDIGVQATISMVLASSPPDGETFAELIRCTARALYRAKAEGRNRAVAYRST